MQVFDDENNNVTTSLLKFAWTKNDHGKMLTCRASNRQLDASAVEDLLRLDIQCKPMKIGTTVQGNGLASFNVLS